LFIICEHLLPDLGLENKNDIFIFSIFEMLFINLNLNAMSHEKAKAQEHNKKEPAKSLKEKRALKKAKKEEKKRQ
jgi:hypothetical protein